MTYQNALKLKTGDAVSIKLIRRKLSVVRIEVDTQSKDVSIYCSDGRRYHHRALILQNDKSVIS